MGERRATRVLTICGSLQARSANRAALEAVAAHLRARERVNVWSFDQLGAVPPFDPDHMEDPGPVVGELRTQLAWSDAVVIAAPEYAGAVAGSVKNALDWIVGSGELYGKAVAVISAGTSGGEQARRDLIRTLTWQGAFVIAELGIVAPRTKSDPEGRYTDADTVGALEALATVAAATVAMDEHARYELAAAIVTAAGVDAGRLRPPA